MIANNHIGDEGALYLSNVLRNNKVIYIHFVSISHLILNTDTHEIKYRKQSNWRLWSSTSGT